jgi:uncharacterized protein YfaS (alpha-2-macroglobulin family)
MGLGMKGKIIDGSESRSFSTGKSLISQKLKIKNGKATAEIVNESDQPLFARVLLTGAPIESEEEKIASGIKMSIRYMDGDYNPIDINNLKQGTDFIAEVRIERQNNFKIFREMALTQLFPSGWEILNPRMTGESDGDIPEYQDIRDDRVYTYFDLPVHQDKIFRMRLNAAYKGKFYLPAVKCAGMYDNSIISIEPGRWVEVK